MNGTHRRRLLSSQDEEAVGHRFIIYMLMLLIFPVCIYEGSTELIIAEYTTDSVIRITSGFKAAICIVVGILSLGISWGLLLRLLAYDKVTS